MLETQSLCVCVIVVYSILRVGEAQTSVFDWRIVTTRMLSVEHATTAHTHSAYVRSHNTKTVLLNVWKLYPRPQHSA